jgi:DNA-binding transcriptional LysR family regulator
MRDGDTVFEPSLSWRLQFDDQEAIADAAVAGMGIAWLPSWLVAKRVARGQLVPLLPDHGSVEMHTYAVWPSAQHLPMRLRVVIDSLAVGLEDSAAG